MIEIREEQPEDVAAIRELNDRAFGQELEGKIVDALRANRAALLSLVATLDDQVVGHIMYSATTIGDVTGAGMAPMAVLPEHQRLGIGSRMVEAGNQKLKDEGYPFIIVLVIHTSTRDLGSGRLGISCEWEAPADVFMILVLDKAKMQGVSGPAKYREEFSVADEHG